MIDLLKEYAYKKADLLKMEATEKSVLLIGTISFLLLVIFSAVLFFIFLLFGLGFLLGAYLDNYGYGLLIVAGFYFLVLIVLFLSRKGIKNWVANKMLKIFEN